MFRFSRRTRGELMRDELGQSWNHFMAAATHAATGLGQSVGPSATRLRGAASRGWYTTSATLAPMAISYRKGAADAVGTALRLGKSARGRKGSSMSNMRMGRLSRLLAVGATVGAVGALMMRRRRRQQWAEYDPTSALESIAAEQGSPVSKLTRRTSKAMDKTAEKLQSAASSMRTGEPGSRPDEAAQRASETTDSMVTRLGSPKTQQ
jgi:hypothetical protein